MQRSEPIPEKIGRGMMGAVYKAVDPLLDRPVALKVIRLAFPVSESELESFETRFTAEGQIVARLSHPGIVTVHDVGRDETLACPYIALQYLVGRTLQAILDEDEPLDWRESVRIVALIARALHYAHHQSVVHRDIKPANIMILESGEPKIMDFGVAKLQAGFGLTSTGQFMGSPLYMSPEQALSQPVDGRSDLFSLGSMAYTMLTGSHAFEADAVPLILNRVAYSEPPPPSQLADGLPTSLDYVVARTLAKPPESRYAEGQTMAEDLEDALAGRVPRHQAGWQAPLRTGGGTVVSQSPPEQATPAAPTSEPLPVASAAGSTQRSSAQTPPAASHTPSATSAVEGFGAASPKTTSHEAREVAPAFRCDRRAGHDLYFSSFWQPRIENLLNPSERRAESERLIALIPVAADEALSQAERAARPVSESARARAGEIARAAQAPSTPAPVSAPATDDETTLVGDAEVRWSSGLAADPESAGRLSVSLESEVDIGTLAIWVDDTLAFRAALDSPVRRQRTLIFRSEDGGYQGTLPVAPGERHIRVELAGAASARVMTIAGTFGPGRSRHLYVVAAASGDPLSLAWRAGGRPLPADEAER